MGVTVLIEISFMKKISFCFLLLLAIISSTLSQTLPDYKRSDLSIEERVKDLLQRMTPEEKFWQLFMIPGDLGNDPSKYKNGIFGFQVTRSATTGSRRTITQL